MGQIDVDGAVCVPSEGLEAVSRAQAMALLDTSAAAWSGERMAIRNARRLDPITEARVYVGRREEIVAALRLVARGIYREP